jgi:hypothetical protein
MLLLAHHNAGLIGPQGGECLPSPELIVPRRSVWMIARIRSMRDIPKVSQRSSPTE